jgi:RHS repeat-associated protein
MPDVAPWSFPAEERERGASERRGGRMRLGSGTPRAPLSARRVGLAAAVTRRSTRAPERLRPREIAPVIMPVPVRAPHSELAVVIHVEPRRAHVSVDVAARKHASGDFDFRDAPRVWLVEPQARGPPRESPVAPTTIASDPCFTGKEEDVEVGIVYFGKRFYSAQLGRWLSPDPLEIHAGGADPNLYAYVRGRALQAIDPLGLLDTGGTSSTGQGGAQGTSGVNPHGSGPETAAGRQYEAPALIPMVSTARAVPEPAGHEGAPNASPPAGQGGAANATPGEGDSGGALLGAAAVGLAQMTPPGRVATAVRAIAGAVAMDGMNEGDAEMTGVGLAVFPLARGTSSETAAIRSAMRAEGIAPVAAGSRAVNEVPTTLARVIPGEGSFRSLGPPGRTDVFVTAADDIAGLGASGIAERLTIPRSSSFTVIEFSTPAEGLASPVFRTDPGFVGGGFTAGGAREFVLPNGPIPAGAATRVVR